MSHKKPQSLHGDRPKVGELPVPEDVEREIRAHLSQRAEELEAEGWEPAAARAEARRLFGDVEEIRARSEAETRARDRAVRRAYRWEAVMQDVRYTLRSLARSPGFAIVAILTLALGIGANSAIFSILNGVLLKPLPYPEPEELVWINEAHDGPAARPGPVPWANFLDWQAASTSFDALASFGFSGRPVLGGDQPVSLVLSWISADFWEVFPVRPVAGRLTFQEEHIEGGPASVVVSERYWESYTGRDPNLVGKILEVDGTPSTVVGIAPRGFNFPSDADVWTPLERTEQGQSRTAHNFRVVGRLTDGVTLEAADRELDAISIRMVEGLPEADYDLEGAIVVPLREQLAGGARQPLLLLMSAALMVLLIAATNLASTLLARGASRSRELAVRASLGAGRGRLMRQLLTESFVLSTAGALAGLGLAAIVLRVLKGFGADSIPRIEEIAIDPSVLLFTLMAALLTTLLCGLVPALRLAEGNLATELRAGTRGNAKGQGLIWRLLVGAEVALALLLLAGGGLLVRSFQQIMSVETGFEAEGLVTVSTQLSAARYPELTDYSDFYQRLGARLEQTPEVAEAAVATIFPMGGGLATGGVNINLNDEDYVGSGAYVAVTPNYFDVMGISVMRGRPFLDTDRDPDGEHVAIVSEAYAEAMWPGQDPIGQVMTSGGMDNYWNDTRWATIVGVVSDVKYASMTGDFDPAYYFPIYQRPFRSRSRFHVIARGAGEDQGVTLSAVRRVMSDMDPTTPLTLQSMDERIAISLAERRFVLAILGAFAGLALLLAGIGIYGVVAYHVANRVREMGIRLALGASPSSVRMSVVRGALLMVGGGLIVGGGGALLGGRLVHGFLFGVAPTDPATLIVVTILLAGTAVVAAWVPATRATRVDPISAMRAE